MGGQRVGDGVHGGAERSLTVTGRHLAGQGAAVLLAHPFGHAFGSHRSEELERLLQQQDQQVVAAGKEVEGRVVADGPEALGGTAGPVACGALHGHLDIAAGGQSLEMVAGHIGMEGEAGGDLERRGPGFERTKR